MKKGLLSIILLLLLTASYSQWNADTLIRNPVCVLDGFRFNLQACSDGHGGTIMTWSDEQRPGDLSSRIYAQRIDSTGITKWATNGIRISPAYITSAETPLIVTDEKGGAIIIYGRSRLGGAIDNFAQRIDANGKLLWGANGIFITDTTADSRLRINTVTNQTAVSDGAGGVFVTWQQYFRGISAQHIDANGNRLWGEDGLLPVTDADSSSRYASYILNTGGGTAVMAFQSSPGTNLRLQRIAANGALLWGTNGIVAVNNSFTENSNSYLAFDSVSATKNIILVWPDSRTGTSNGFVSHLYAQKFDLTGKPQWTANGVLVAGDTYDDTYPVLLTDNDGGFFMSYNGITNATLQHVDKSGNLLWGSAGVTGGLGQSETREPNMCRDGSGGLILIDRCRVRGDSLVILAQRFTSSGKQLWRAGGVPVIMGYPGDVSTLVSVNDGTAIASWIDFRATHTQKPTYIYAAKFGGSSGILPVTLLSFTGSVSNSQVQLQWATTQEINSSYFEVQRSVDGIHFNPIQHMPSQGSSKLTNNYTATDATPFNGPDFYRLKQVDNDGAFTYSNIILVTFNTKFTISLSPVPAHDFVMINGTGNFSAVQLIDMNGKVVKQFNNVQSNKLNISSLPSGVYFVRLLYNKDVQVLKLIKQ